MATHTGKEGMVRIGANTIAETKDWSIEQTGETVDSTTASNTAGWRTHKHTWKAWTGSVDCLWDPADTNGQNALTISSSITINFFANGNTTGDINYNGTATVTAITFNSEIDGMINASFTFQGNGALARTVVA